MRQQALCSALMSPGAQEPHTKKDLDRQCPNAQQTNPASPCPTSCQLGSRFMGCRFPGQGAKRVKVLLDIPCSQHGQAPTYSQPHYLRITAPEVRRRRRRDEGCTGTCRGDVLQSPHISTLGASKQEKDSQAAALPSVPVEHSLQ